MEIIERGMGNWLEEKYSNNQKYLSHRRKSFLLSSCSTGSIILIVELLGFTCIIKTSPAWFIPVTWTSLVYHHERSRKIDVIELENENGPPKAVGLILDEILN